MLKIGFAARDFTPPRPAMVQGQMHVRIAHDAADPLTLTALAIDGGTSAGRRALLLSFDLPMVSDELQNAVRAQLHHLIPDLPPDAVIMNGTHTHDALVIDDGFYPHPGGDVMTAREGMEWVAVRAVEAAREAWLNRAPRLFNRAFGHAVVGHNRRAVFADGHARMYAKTHDPTFRHIEGYEDHGLDMLFFWEPDGRLAGLALCIPCPSQVEEHLSRFSADYWHDVRLDLRRRFGQHLFVLPLCGAAGDQSPHFLLYAREEAEMRRRRGLTERQEIAARVGDAVERALTCTHPGPADIPFAHLSKNLDLPARPMTRVERDWAAAEHAETVRKGMPQNLWWPVRLREVVDLFDRNLPMPAQQAEVHILRLGDTAIATNPFELFLDYGLQIKAQSPADQTVVVQLASGTGFYLPTERAVQGGHYGAHPVVAPAGPGAGRVLVEETLAALRSLFPPDRPAPA